MLKTGDTVEAVVLGVNTGEHRLSLGLKQTLGDPWAEIEQKFPAGSAIEGPVTSFTKFGAFVQLADGVEGMVHVSEISAEKHIHHPQDVLRLGQVVKAQVLEVDKAKRQLRLSMKQRTTRQPGRISCRPSAGQRGHRAHSRGFAGVGEGRAGRRH